MTTKSIATVLINGVAFAIIIITTCESRIQKPNSFAHLKRSGALSFTAPIVYMVVVTIIVCLAFFLSIALWRLWVALANASFVLIYLVLSQVKLTFWPSLIT